MRFYQKYFPGNYEELITYYPSFYRSVLEMRAILEAHGAVLDELEDNIERVFLNNFIDTADERTIENWERFLDIRSGRTQEWELRRRLVKACFVGFGKIAASTLEKMISAYTNGWVYSRFEPDRSGNHLLFLDFGRGDLEVVDIESLLLLISKKLPAHIACRLSFNETPQSAPLRVGVTGSIIIRLAPVEQPDNLTAAHTVYMGGQAQTITRRTPTEQPDNLTAAHSVYIGGTAQTIVRAAPVAQPDNLTAAQTIHMGGQAQTVACRAPAAQPDTPPKPRTVYTSGAGIVVTVLRGREI